MSYRLIVDAGAEGDIDFAYRWYEARSRGLGTRFLDEIESCLDRVIINPMSYPEVEAGIRRALPHAFPYLVFYTVAVAPGTQYTDRADREPSHVREAGLHQRGGTGAVLLPLGRMRYIVRPQVPLTLDLRIGNVAS